MHFRQALLAWLACLLLLTPSDASGKLSRHAKIRAKQNHLKREHARPLASRQVSDAKKFRFLTDATSPYRVTSLPLLNYDIGEVYSGLLPIDGNDTSRELFFVFQPRISGPAVDEITIWLNGGPGCSSLEGFFQKNGFFVWQFGQWEPSTNPYSWPNLTNVLWVESPVGTGFTTGKVRARNEKNVANDFIKFFKNFQTLFDIENFKIYVTGESYAGRYVSYISAAMLDQNDTIHYDLQGSLIYDGTIGDFEDVQEEAVVVPFINQNSILFNLNQSFLGQLDTLHQECGYADYINKYLRFPPVGIQPPGSTINATSTSGICDVWDLALNAALTVNPCFNPYHISDTCPIPFDPLGFEGDLLYTEPGWTVYFNRQDVKIAMHAPLNISWSECSVGSVFVGNAGPEGEGDRSPDPIQTVLPRVIEATNRVLIADAEWDMVIVGNGTLLSIQNMTWNGNLGFQSFDTKPINIQLPDLQYQAVFAANGLAGVDQGQGIMGYQHHERGLMYARTFQCGHMQPQYQPGVSYRHLQWLLGRINTL